MNGYKVTANGTAKAVSETDATATADVEWNDDLATAEFTNSYALGSVKVTKVVSGTDLPDDFNITNDYNSTEFNLTNKAGGTGTATDPYYWTIENVAIGTVITFTEHNIQVNGHILTANGTTMATNDTNAIATVEVNWDDDFATAEFNNSYMSIGQISFEGKKILVNRKLKEGEFSFELKDEAGTTLQTVKNDAEGKITFEPIQYTVNDMLDENGKYLNTTIKKYTISEVKPEDYDKTVIYSGKTIEITVTLTDDQREGINAVASDEALNINFTNTVVKGKKVDITTQEELEDAKIQIIEVDEEGNEKVVFEFTSGEEDTEIENLETGKTYIMREVVAPHGYDVTSDTTFTVDEEGNIKTTANSTYDEEGNFILLVEDDMFRVTAAVKKIWVDEKNQDGVRPISLKVNLMQRTADGTVSAVKVDRDGKAITIPALTADNGWSATVKNLPMVDKDLKDIEYFWTEDEVAEYTASSKTVKEADDVKTIGFVTTLTNVHGPASKDVRVEKAWDDEGNAYKTRPESIKVQLYANGVACGEAVTLSEANSWAYTWTGLTKYTNPTGQSFMAKEIVYTVEELNVPEGYTAKITGNGTANIVITNTIERGKLVIEKTFDFVPIEPEEPDNTPFDIPVIKTWNDNGNKDGNRPASVTVRLLADGVEVANAQLTAEGGWTTTFTGLPRYNGETKINYTITEDPVDWYTAEIHGYNIRNNYKPEVTSVSVRKVWNDNNNANQTRPTSIYATLSNGTVVLLNAENNWTATVDNLPTRINGQEAVYTWTEQTVIGYRQTNVAQDGNTTVFTNTVITPPKTEEGKKPPKAPGGDVAFFDEYPTALGVEVYIKQVGDCFD